MSTNRTQATLTRGELAGVTWHISTRSPNTSGQCVEAGPLDDGSDRVAVRHSHHPDGHVLACSHHEWTVFTAGIKAGDFDFTDQ